MQFLERYILLIVEDRAYVLVSEGGKIKLLIRKKSHGLSQYTEFHWVEILRAFGYDDYIGTVLSTLGFAKSSGRKKFIINDDTVIINEEDVYTWLDITVLKGIIKENDISRLCFGIICKSVNTFTPFFIHGNEYFRKFFMHLKRLVSDFMHRGMFSCQNIAMAFALISAA